MRHGRAARLDDVWAGVRQRVAQGGRQVRRGGRQRAPAARQDGPSRQAHQRQPHLLGRLGRRAVAACRSANGCTVSFTCRLLITARLAQGRGMASCCHVECCTIGFKGAGSTRGDTLCLWQWLGCLHEQHSGRRDRDCASADSEADAWAACASSMPGCRLATDETSVYKPRSRPSAEETKQTMWNDNL